MSMRTPEILDPIGRELALAADELNDQQRRAAHFAPSFVFVGHQLDWLSASLPVLFDKEAEQPLVQFQEPYDQTDSSSRLVDLTLGANLLVRHCSVARWFPMRLLFGRGIRWRSRSPYEPDNIGDLATTYVTLMVLKDGSPALIARPVSLWNIPYGRSSPPSRRYSGDLAGWQKLLYETGYPPLVKQR